MNFKLQLMQFAPGKINQIHHQQDDWNEVHQQLMQVQANSKIQPKSLEVSQPNDPDEREADEIASKIMNGQPAGVHGTGNDVNRKGEGEIEVGQQFESQLQSHKGAGQSLPGNLQRELGGPMGADLGGVKIHTGAEAHSMNEAVNAKAFTYGQDIFFRDGHYNPGSKQGKELLAHELVHTQQQSGKVQPKIMRSAMVERNRGNKTVLVTGNINYFGPGATDAFAKSATDTIQRFWNNVNIGAKKKKDKYGTVVLKEKGKNDVEEEVTYKIEFKFTYTFYDPKKFSDAQMQEVAFSKGADYKENFVRVIQKSESGAASSMTGNFATFYIDGADKAEYAHEFGHGMGLEDHTLGKPIRVVDDQTQKKYGFHQEESDHTQASDFRGIVSIMIGGPDNDEENYSLVDPEFMKDPTTTVTGTGGTVHVSGPGGKLDPNKRRVSQFDINNLKIQNALGENDKGYLNPITKPVSVSSWFGTVSMTRLGPEIHSPTIYSEGLKLSGKKDGEFIQQVFLDFRYEGDWPNITRFFTNPTLGSRTNNAEIPAMKDLYIPGTIRYEYYDRNGNVLMPFHPDKVVDGLPAPDANWTDGYAEPMPGK